MIQLKYRILLFIGLFFVYAGNAQIWILGGKKRYGNGKIGSKTVLVDTFKTLKIKGEFDVYIVDSLWNSLEIKGDKNLLDYIKVKERRNGTLTITNPIVNQLIPKNKRIKLYIPAMPLSRLQISGSAHLFSDVTFKSASFDIRVRGSGEINLNVEVDALKASVSGSGRIILSGAYEKGNFKVRGSGRIKRPTSSLQQ